MRQLCFPELCPHRSGSTTVTVLPERQVVAFPGCSPPAPALTGWAEYLLWFFLSFAGEELTSEIPAARLAWSLLMPQAKLLGVPEYDLTPPDLFSLISDPLTFQNHSVLSPPDLVPTVPSVWNKLPLAPLLCLGEPYSAFRTQLGHLLP